MSIFFKKKFKLGDLFSFLARKSEYLKSTQIASAHFLKEKRWISSFAGDIPN